MRGGKHLRMGVNSRVVVKGKDRVPILKGPNGKFRGPRPQVLGALELGRFASELKGSAFGLVWVKRFIFGPVVFSRGVPKYIHMRGRSRGLLYVRKFRSLIGRWRQV